jgi:WD40 repeat protein
MCAATTGKLLSTLKLRMTENGVSAVTFSPDGRLLAMGSSNGTIMLWDASEIKVPKK